MATRDVPKLLAEWRAADRRWEATAQDDPTFREACIDVIRTWLAYHSAIDDQQPGEFALVTDDHRLYVAASDGVRATLGHTPASILGRRIEDLAGLDVAAGIGDLWAAFLADGRQDGTLALIHRDGSDVRLQYQARAHFPIAHFHLSRLWPAGPDEPVGDPAAATG